MSKRVLVEGHGCSSNAALTGSIEALLRDGGFDIVDSVDRADFVVVNTCTVKSQTEQRMLTRIAELSARLKTTVTGCMADAQPGLLKTVFPSVSIVSPSLIDRIPEIVRSEKATTLVDKTGLPRLIPTVKNNRLIVPISRGCLGHCTYCIVKTALGNLRSYSPEDIIGYVKCSLEQRPAELFITSQDTAIFGRDLDCHVDLIGLTQRLLALEGRFMVRIGMMAPNTAYDIRAGLVELYRNDRVYRFLHLPLQSGDNTILRAMGREYDSSTFMELVEFFRHEIPDLTVATDVIAGFPGEDEQSFRKTLRVLEATRPDKVNISRFSPRPHTIANLMPQTRATVAAARSRELTEVCRRICLERRRGLVGSVVQGMFLKSKESTIHGRTKQFIPIKCPLKGDVEMGRLYEIHVTAVSPAGIRGEISRPV